MAIPQEKYYEDNRGKDLRRAENPKHWVVSEMWDMHHEIARLILLGRNNVRIAEELKISPQTVSNVRNSPVVQEHLAIMQGARDADTIDLAKEIKNIAPDALMLLKNIVKGENDGVNASIGLRARTAENMLARVGHGVPHKIQSESVSFVLTSKDIADIKARAAIGENVQEAEFEEAVQS